MIAANARPPHRFLSTPSARRATIDRSKCKTAAQISIHALREEGDTGSYSDTSQYVDFYPRPPRGGRPPGSAPGPLSRGDFYPRPPRGGRLGSFPGPEVGGQFLSTPSARRATSILSSSSLSCPNFYPRPPRGGRRGIRDMTVLERLFLSTPSARRATHSRRP